MLESWSWSWVRYTCLIGATHGGLPKSLDPSGINVQHLPFRPVEVTAEVMAAVLPSRASREDGVP
jgi:hypothetical protein